ncbi:hypothetical protein F3Y22_tig00111650pilonHSYRG00227 [Hibiscus syriacus]|uniref:Uncharacterized protein n=1 Tax=Hibiscus syriacus TaxID=106335 RepID=A0A6A2XYV5_HIBSY|nr:hypothetical protein F3Y22_tig00111650pilonHSYRG00227 [Hibiscus syriacus]
MRKLDDHNYLLCHQQVYLTIKAHRLLKYIDSKVSVPPEHVVLEGQDSINPDFVFFEEQDGAITTWLLSTVSESVLPHLIGLNIASEIWNTLHKLYSGKTTSRLMSYRRLLHSQKKGEMSMRDYLMVIKIICDNLASCGELIFDHEHIITILNGLPPEYEVIITVITAGTSSFDLGWLVLIARSMFLLINTMIKSLLILLLILPTFLPPIAIIISIIAITVEAEADLTLLGLNVSYVEEWGILLKDSISYLM